MAVMEDTVICGYIQHPADVVEIFNAWGTAAALQIILEGYGMAEQFCALRLFRCFFFLAFFKAALKTWASLMDKDIVVISYK